MKIYDFKADNRYGDEVSLSEFEGNVVLILNSATKCGFTPQYDALQDLYEKYADDGFVILDFPCNQFGNQAPGTVDEIITFCDSNFGVTFPIFSKIDVNGDHAHPLFKALVNEKGFQGFDPEHPIAEKLDEILSAANPNYKDDPSIKWNFTKFLIGRNGELVERYEPTADLYDIEEKIKEIL